MNLFLFVFDLALALLFSNAVPLFSILRLPVVLKILAMIILFFWFVQRLFRTGKSAPEFKKLRKIEHGCALVRLSGFMAVSEIIVLWIYIAKYSPRAVNIIFSVLLPVIIIAIVLFTGIIRIGLNSRQVKITDHFLLIMLWWFPVVNIFLFRKFYKTGKREYIFEKDRLELENTRIESEICRTKYPVIMVHGIFFRDWQYFNYWGRVPAALIRNGADIYYGGQQSADSIERSANELKNKILQVLNETGAEKVNIIAHSKGGLDSRYAISRLGMDKYVATLTTINTPHEGCDMVDFLLGKCPQGLVDFISGKYNRIFSALGDNAPDFISGVRDLSAVRAKSFDSEFPDMPDVSYRSFMTVMTSAGSAFFPLNISYRIIKKLNGANDGLVYEKSAAHGRYTLVKHSGRRGICHGDVIDLMRENIEGFDVREFYVNIVKQLKTEGF